MLRFLRTQYPSKMFMPALGVKTSTFHRWEDCGYIYLGRPGTGKPVILTGEEILYAACLAILSKVGGNSKFLVRGLRDCVAFFRSGLGEWNIKEWDTSGNPIFHKYPEIMYAVFKFVERCDGSVIDGEWALAANPLEYIEGRAHITEAFDYKAAPYSQIICLTDLLRDLVLKIDGRAV
jgi:hypothetical protein